MGSNTHRFGSKFNISRLPPIASNLPCGLRYEREKHEPVVVLVFLEIGIGDEEEFVEQGHVFRRNDALPNL